MKILIPFSGGVNSTYTMWRWLTETDYEVVARYAIEEYENDDTNNAAIEKLKKTIQFLKNKTRDFIFEEINWITTYEEDRVPIREGFKTTYNVGALRPRYETYPLWIKETGVDAISIGISLENTALDCGYFHLHKLFEDTGVDTYLAGSPKLEPVPQGDNFDWDNISKKITGRFEQYDFLPDELKVLSRRCHPSTCKKRQCRDCAYWRTYERFVSEGKTGRDFDLYCAKHGSYGPWRHEAEAGEKEILPYLDYY